MNEHDSEILRGLIEKKGYVRGTKAEECDLVVLYTCCIREKAEAKVFGRIGALCKLKRNKKAFMKIAVGGCMTQQEDVARKILDNFHGVDIIFGTHNLALFDELLTLESDQEKRIFDVSDNDGVIIKEDVPIKRDSSLKAYVNIIYGCNNFCSYCIVPYVRGREKSRTIESIKKEVSGLISEGYKDITLLGQNVNSYGKDFKDGTKFIDLLKELDSLGDYRLRFMSSHPRDFDFELLDYIKESNNVCPQFHLPLQSGSSRVIKLMNRGYTKEHYLGLIKHIKDNFQEYSISTDIIVGFPGETEEDFQDTLDVVNEVGFDQSYMFIYSLREGTKAEKMSGHLSEAVKKERFHRLLDLQNIRSKEVNESTLGKVFEVLVEEKTPMGLYQGRTVGNKVINFEGTPEIVGKLVMVKVTSFNTYSLRGEVL